MLVTEQNYKEIRDRLAQTDVWTIDVETNGLDPFNKNQICGLGIGMLEGEEHYFPFRHQQGTNLPIHMQKDLITLVNTRKTLIGYNLKFDLHFLPLIAKSKLEVTPLIIVLNVLSFVPSGVIGFPSPTLVLGQSGVPSAAKVIALAVIGFDIFEEHEINKKRKIVTVMDLNPLQLLQLGP